ncbi:MAG TPA: diguanylate cyclase [Candidatus Binatia bacterium]
MSSAVTCSCGVALAPMHAETEDAWVKMADAAMYEAKQLGRNLVRVSGEPPPAPDQVRKPARKVALPGTLSEEMSERLRLDLLRRGGAMCPVNQIPLDARDITTVGERGRSFLVTCPGCGFNATLPGPGS